MKKIKIFVSLAVVMAVMLSAVSVNATECAGYSFGHNEAATHNTLTAVKGYLNPDDECFVSLDMAVTSHAFGPTDNLQDEVELSFSLTAKSGTSTFASYYKYQRFGPYSSNISINFSSQYPTGISYSVSDGVDNFEGIGFTSYNGEDWYDPVIYLTTLDVGAVQFY